MNSQEKIYLKTNSWKSKLMNPEVNIQISMENEITEKKSIWWKSKEEWG